MLPQNDDSQQARVPSTSEHASMIGEDVRAKALGEGTGDDSGGEGHIGRLYLVSGVVSAYKTQFPPPGQQ